MDFASLRVRKLALPIKHHIKKIQIEQKPENLKYEVDFFPQLQQHFFHYLRRAQLTFILLSLFTFLLWHFSKFDSELNVAAINKYQQQCILLS